MSKNKESIQLLRKKGTDDSVTLKYGQPFYNSQKNYLTVGTEGITEGGNKAPNKKTSGRPIAARELVAYNGDTEDNIKTDSDSEPSEKVGSVEFDSFGNLTISRARAGEFTSLNKDNPLYEQLLGDKPSEPDKPDEPGRPGIVLKGRGRDNSKDKDLTFYNYLYADDNNGLIIGRAHVYDGNDIDPPTIRDGGMLTPSLLLMSKKLDGDTVKDHVSMSIAAEQSELRITDWASNSDTFTLSLKNGKAKEDGSYGASGTIEIGETFKFNKPITVDVTNGKILNVGDDAWITDKGLAGCVGIVPQNDSSGSIALFTQDESSYGSIVYDGEKINFNSSLYSTGSKCYYLAGKLEGSILKLYTY